MNLYYKNKKAVTLIETLVTVTILAVVSLALYQIFTKIIEVTAVIQDKLAITSIATEQLEIIRNIPYSSVGTVGGIPAGVITPNQVLVRDYNTYNINTVVRAIDEPFDGVYPTDTNPGDNKLIEISVTCTDCRKPVTVTYTSHVAPKNFESESSNGVLLIRVFDANGVALPDASVTIINNSLIPAVNTTQTTDNNGQLLLIDAPPATNTYQISVTKTGYSTDATTATKSGTSTATKAHASVIAEGITQVSFAIDIVGTVQITSKTTSCGAVSSMDYNLVGSKKSFTTPDLFKYNVTSATDSSGNKTLSNMEWDSYHISFLDTVYDFIGSNTMDPISLNPGETKIIDAIVAPKDGVRRVFAVKDFASGLPLANATVVLTKTGYSATKSTGVGYITQTDWSGGGSQTLYTDTTKFQSSDSNVNTTSTPGQITLTTTGGTDGVLTSSAIDIASGNLFTIGWEPTSQSAGTSVKFQLAVADTTLLSDYTFIGPDGTSATYFTTSNSSLSAMTQFQGHKYVRYKLFLHADTPATARPIVSDITVGYSSSCTPAGYVNFSSLSNGTYTATISNSGYNTQTSTFTLTTGSPVWDLITINMHVE